MTDNEEIYEESSDEYEEEQGIIDRIINVFLDPAALFKGLAKRPEFWTPIVAIALITIILSITTSPFTEDMRLEDHRVKWRMQADGDDEEKDNQILENERAYVEKGRKSEPYIGGVGGSITKVIVLLAVTMVIYMLSLIQGLETKFVRLFSVIAYASLIPALREILDKLLKVTGIVGIESLDSWRMPVTSLASYLPIDIHMVIYYLCKLIDPFTIWNLIILIIGLRFANRCSLKSAIVTVIIYFGLLVLLFAVIGFYREMLVNKAAETAGGTVVIQAG